MQGVIELIPTTGEARACRSLGITRGELRRQRLRALAANNAAQYGRPDHRNKHQPAYWLNKLLQ